MFLQSQRIAVVVVVVVVMPFASRVMNLSSVRWAAVCVMMMMSYGSCCQYRNCVAFICVHFSDQVALLDAITARHQFD